MILKLIWRSKRPRIVNTILKKNKLEDQHHLILTHCKNYNNQDSTVLVRKNRQTDQWTRIQSLIDPQRYSQLIFDKANAIQWSKDSFFTNGAAQIESR